MWLFRLVLKEYGTIIIDIYCRCVLWDQPRALPSVNAVAELVHFSANRALRLEQPLPQSPEQIFKLELRGWKSKPFRRKHIFCVTNRCRPRWLFEKSKRMILHNQPQVLPGSTLTLAFNEQWLTKRRDKQHHDPSPPPPLMTAILVLFSAVENILAGVTINI